MRGERALRNDPDALFRKRKRFVVARDAGGPGAVSFVTKLTAAVKQHTRGFVQTAGKQHC